jgi:glycosyltransferase involved in cell wall biosynthesis
MTAASIHFTPSLASSDGGPAYSVPRLCHSLRSLKQNAFCVCHSPNSLTANSWEKAFPPPLGFRAVGYSPNLLKWLKQQLPNLNNTVLHCHGLWLLTGICFCRFARRHSLPIVISPRGMLSSWALKHGSLLKSASWHTLQKRTLAAASGFHATSELELLDIRRLGFRNPVAVIPNGLDVPDIRKGKNLENQTLLYLGRIHPKKGIDTLLLIWPHLSDKYPNWHLRIVGGSIVDDQSSESYLAYLKKLASGLGLSRVTFEPAVYGQAKSDCFADAALFVLPSKSENFGLVVGESLACGTPVLTTTATPWADLEHRDAGRCVPPDADSLRAALDSLMGGSLARLEEMGWNGRAWIKSSFQWEDVGRQMLEFYEWILGINAVPPGFVDLP